MNTIGYFIKKTRSSRTAKFWLISYILILLLPILFSFISYYYVESNLVQKIKQTNESHLKNTQTFLDSTIGSIVSATTELSANKSISALAQQNAPISGEQRLNMMLAPNDVWRTYYVYTEYIKNKYIYFADTNSIYTGNAITPEHYYWLRTYNTDENNLTEDTWKTNILSKSTSGFVCLNSGGKTRVFFVFPTYKYATNQVLYSTVAELNFDKLISDAAGSIKGSFYMHSSDGTVISDDISPAEEQAVRAIGKVSDRNSSYYCTDGLVVMRTMSNVSNWSYGYVTKYSDYWASLQNARIFMWTSSLLCLIIGLVIIVYLVKRNNKPLEDIVNLLSPGGVPQAYDAYEYILTAS